MTKEVYVVLRNDCAVYAVFSTYEAAKKYVKNLTRDILDFSIQKVNYFEEQEKT